MDGVRRERWGEGRKKEKEKMGGKQKGKGSRKEGKSKGEGERKKTKHNLTPKKTTNSQLPTLNPTPTLSGKLRFLY